MKLGKAQAMIITLQAKKKKWCGKGKKTLDDYKAQQYTWSNYTVK